MSLISAALVDVGGTLWPERWPAPREDDEFRVSRLLQAVPGLKRDQASELIERFRAGAERDKDLVQDHSAFVRETFRQARFLLDVGSVEIVRRAMCLPAAGRWELFPGTRELLATIKELHLGCVLVSNAVWRTGADYRADFEEFGVATSIDDFVSSIDVGFRKPHRAIFEAALKACACDAGSCVMIGNSEQLDVEPAVAMGMRTIRVAIEEPKPAASAAHAVACSLHEAAAVLRAWI